MIPRRSVKRVHIARSFGALVVALGALLLTACTLVITPPAATPPQTARQVTPAPSAPRVKEARLTAIPLTGPVSERNAQISGLAWYGDNLILLPQYPDFVTGNGRGFILAIPKAEILAVLDGSRTDPIEPRQIPFEAPDIRSAIRGYDGLEAITFDGDTVYVAVEVDGPTYVGSYLLAGEIAPDLSKLVLDTTQWVAVEGRAGLRNLAEESMLMADGRPITIYEANGAGVSAEPVAHQIDPVRLSAGELPFPAIEYRVTDATAADADGRFWVINYFFPGDIHLHTAADPLAIRFGQGASHAASQHVERLVELVFATDGIHLTDTPPIQLELSLEPRNWEGIARLDDRGFLLATDTFPRTILAFAPLDR